MRPIALLALLVLVPACSTPPIRERFVDAMEDGEPVVGEMHGAFPELNQYVFTYRNPEKFFEFVEVSLVAEQPDVAATLATLRRHDKVRLTGTLLDNPSPQMHVEVASVELLKKFEPVPEVPDYGYASGTIDELAKQDTGLFLVHAVQSGGGVFVVEYRDVVLPVYIRTPELVKDLARNDVVRLAYKVRKSPHEPTHLELRDVPTPVEVVESVMAMEGTPADIEGALVLFPKSPQIKFDVWAVLHELPGGLQRQYTLLPPPPTTMDPVAQAEFDAKFQAVRDKLKAAWDAAGPNTSESGRNKLISTKVRVRATGKFNEEQANQANVQIFLEGPESVEIVEG